MSGLTPSGFERKRLTDIKSSLEQSLKNAFGENIDLDPQSGFGQFVGIISEAISDQWESQENVYNSQYPSTAQQNQLSNVVQYNGITRQDATKSTVVGTIAGTDGTVIPAGTVASVQFTGCRFVTIKDVTISGPTLVDLESEDSGPVQAIAGTLTVIETPIFGWTSITNSNDAIVGRSEESDAALRIRRELSTQALGQNLSDALFGQLLNIPAVEDAVVVSNGTDLVSPEGIPAHTFLSSIIGGDDNEIANTIWKNTPQGIDSFGSTTINITDSQGFTQEIKFTRPSEIEIYFEVNIQTNTNFPGTGEDEIKQAIVDYGIENFKISDDVILSRFYTPINTVKGITSIQLFIGITSNPTGTSNITIDFDEISRYSTSRVEVNIV